MCSGSLKLIECTSSLEEPVELWYTFRRETLQAVKECTGDSPGLYGVALPQRGRWKILRRVALQDLLEIRTATRLCHIGLELFWGEMRRGMSGVLLRTSRPFQCWWPRTCLPSTKESSAPSLFLGWVLSEKWRAASCQTRMGRDWAHQTAENSYLSNIQRNKAKGMTEHWVFFLGTGHQPSQRCNQLPIRII